MNYFRRLKITTLLWCVGSLIISLVILQILLEVFYMQETDFRVPESENHQQEFSDLKDVKHPVILWWTPFTLDHLVVKTCGSKKCVFTQDRRFRHHPLLEGVLFYGSQFDLLDLPLPRDGMKIKWALLHEESPKNIPALSHSPALSLFNYTSTFSRYSHSPLTLQYLQDMDVLTDTKYFLPVEQKNYLLHELAPVLYVQSDCSTPLERDAYVAELMKYIPVDSYGTCLQNKKLPLSLADPVKSMEADEFLNFVARYKFTLAFENAVCEDYITEKLWRPLIVGSVPVYMGSPSVKDWLPNNDSAILAADFKSPKELAEYLLAINKDDVLYNSFLEHKLSSSPLTKITNNRLVSALKLRQWGVDNDVAKQNMVDYFECLVCEKVHNEKNNFHSVANTSHYDCPRPVSPLTGKENPENWWLDQWYTGKCEARVLRNFIDTGRLKYSHDELYEEVKLLLSRNKC